MGVDVRLRTLVQPTKAERLHLNESLLRLGYDDIECMRLRTTAEGPPVGVITSLIRYTHLEDPRLLTRWPFISRLLDEVGDALPGHVVLYGNDMGDPENLGEFERVDEAFMLGMWDRYRELGGRERWS